MEAVDHRQGVLAGLAHRVDARRRPSTRLDPSGVLLQDHISQVGGVVLLVVCEVQPDSVDLLELRSEESDPVGDRTAL